MIQPLAALYDDVCREDNDMRPYLPMLVQAVVDTDAAQVIELGVRTGRSTIAFLHGLDMTGGKLWSCDHKQAEVPVAVANSERWTLALGSDLRLVDKAPRPVDVLFVDTTHSYRQTIAELRAYVPLVRPGGLVLAHDTEKFKGVAKAMDEYFGGAWLNHTEGCGMGVAAVAK